MVLPIPFIYGKWYGYGNCHSSLGAVKLPLGLNKVKEELFHLTGTEHSVSSEYHPQTNG